MKNIILLCFFSLLSFGSTANTSFMLSSDKSEGETTTGLESADASTDAMVAQVTLCVDLSCFSSVTAPSVFGAFNGWSANANFVTDPDGDGIYCATVTMADGPQEYLFFTQEEGAENMTPGAPCTVTNFGFTNRIITVAGAPLTETYGWEVCEPTSTCPPPPLTTDVMLCVDLSCLPSVTAPSVFGAFNGWNAGANPLSDPDGNGIYCTTVALEYGDQEYLFFTQEEGAENMTPGAPCTVTNFGFTNRVVTVGSRPQTVLFGWESCSSGCPQPPATTDITLCVDLSCFSSVTAPSVFGTFNGWNAGANPITDPDGDGIYCATIGFEPFSGNQEYLFFFQEQGPENMTPGARCTVTNFGFTNRFVTVGLRPLTLTYGWESCGSTCTGQSMNSFNEEAGTRPLLPADRLKSFTVFPNPTTGQVRINVGDLGEQTGRLTVLDVNGQEVRQVQTGILEHSTESLNLASLPAGLYFIRLQLTDGQVQMERVIVQP